MRFTRFGIHGGLFTSAMFVAFYGSPYSNLFFLLLGFLTLTGVLGVLGARRNLQGVRAHSPAFEPIPSETPVRVELPVTVEARTRFDVRARIKLTGAPELRGRAPVLERRAALALTAPPLPRGRHAVEAAELESAYPFGLLRFVRAFEAPRELLVYPRPLEELAGVTLRDARTALAARPDQSAGDLQPAGLRDHTERDGLRSVHWRASARRGRLVVQEWEGGSGDGLQVLLERRSAPGRFEEALATLSALGQLAKVAKEPLRLETQGLSATFGEGQRPWRELLEILATVDTLPEDGPPPPAASPDVIRLPRAAQRAHGH